MKSPAEVLANNLQELIQVEQITLIRIHMYNLERPCDESSVWVFNHEFVEIEASFYDLNRMIRYECNNSTLSLYF
jgi:hypothetical protein